MNNSMDWSDLRFFLAVSRAGSFMGAARLLGSSQPTVGRRIQALERAVGHKLFQRGTDGLVLTNEGQQVLHYAERVETETLALERTLAGQERVLSGPLRVSSSDWFGDSVLAACIADFGHLHPEVQVELITDARPLSLSRREADLVFRIVPFDEPDVAQRRILTLSYAVYARSARNIPLKAMGKGVNLITLDSQFSELPDAVWLRDKLPRGQVVFRSNSRQAQANYCAASDALAVLPTALGDRIPGLARIDLGEAPPPRQVWIGYHQDLRALRRLRAFIDYVSERLQQDARFANA